MTHSCSRAARFLFALAVLPCAATSTWAWGCKGHQTVALIAEKHLSPEAHEFVDKLLSENPVDPQLKRYCGNSTRDLLVDASTWPDDVRNERKNGPWHYIDIPRGAPRGPLEQYCGNEGCVTKAIADQLAILKDKSADSRKRAEALRYIVHFVGDLHMPLHAASNNDEGGNCVPLRYFRRRPRENRSSFTPNLHAVWDTAILERDMEGAEPPEYAEFLSDIFSAEFPKWQAAGIHVDDWTWESRDLAESIAYGALIPAVPIEIPAPVHSCTDANNIGERMMRLHLFAGEAYQQASAPIVQERIAQAGLRLALILNDAARSSSPAN
ncbi:MAG TPA: S1/P1 nuclease [Candidatus Sulfotelmatobacter sp.]|nr:S1/P1 nuclease [Candidatus Sulfotelmatobacter sp.]